MSYTHISWFSAEAVEKARQEGKIHRMCKYCGNDNPRKLDCPNCDIGFAEYIYQEDIEK
jgi:hypothetical protein